jgi:glycerophosphoryl diester phosphodiesterase
MTPAPRLPQSLRHLPVAHRALHDKSLGRPENSRAAIEAAIDAGYAIEIDLQLSSDGKAMVFHDETLDRLTARTGPIAALTANELGRITLRDAAPGPQAGIPTFAEILAMVAGQVPLLVELKDQTGAMTASDGALEVACARDLDGYKGDIAVMSFNPSMVAHMARLAPLVARGLTTSAYDPLDWAPLPRETCDCLRAIPDYDALGASFISHEWRYLDMARVRDLARAGADVLCWTIRSPEAEAMARALACNITFEGYLAAFRA